MFSKKNKRGKSSIDTQVAKRVKKTEEIESLDSAVCSNDDVPFVVHIGDDLSSCTALSSLRSIPDMSGHSDILEELNIPNEPSHEDLECHGIDGEDIDDENKSGDEEFMSTKKPRSGCLKMGSKECDNIKTPDWGEDSSSEWLKLDRFVMKCFKNRSVDQTSIFTKSTQKTHVISALNMLRGALLIIYKNDQPSNIIENQAERGNVMGIQFNTALTKVAMDCAWSNTTARKILCIVRKILISEGMRCTRASRLRIINHPTIDRRIGRELSRFPQDGHVRALLDQWIPKISESMKHATGQTICKIIQFYRNQMLPAFDVKIEEIAEMRPEDFRERIEKKINMKLVTGICGTKSNCAINAHWMQIFFRAIVRTSYCFSKEQMSMLQKRARQYTIVLHDGEGDHDYHRISKVNIDKLYEQARKKPVEELIFYLFLTTALRIGGIARLTLKGIGEKKDGQWVVQPKCYTVEKGGRRHRFSVQKTVRTMIDRWIRHERPHDPSSYLFPGKFSHHISTSCIRAMVKRWTKGAGLIGKEYHPHAFRHSTAHILKDIGCDILFIQKFLGHRSVATTEKFYTKEDAVEAETRANVPWADCEVKSSSEIFEEIMPMCLQKIFPQKRTLSNRRKEKTEKVLAALAEVAK